MFGENYVKNREKLKYKDTYFSYFIAAIWIFFASAIKSQVWFSHNSQLECRLKQNLAMLDIFLLLKSEQFVCKKTSFFVLITILQKYKKVASVAL